MEDLSPHELFALKEIGLTGQTGQRTLVRQLLEEEIIANVEGGFFELTSKGRSLLVRGSPLLWDIAS
jgi:predicted transcriptional regulator